MLKQHLGLLETQALLAASDSRVRLNPKTLRSLVWLVQAHRQLHPQPLLNHTLMGLFCGVVGQFHTSESAMGLALEGWGASPLRGERSTVGQSMSIAGVGLGLRWARFWGVGRPKVGIWAELPLVTWEGQDLAMSSGTHNGCAPGLGREGTAATLESVPLKVPVCLG